MARLDLDPEAVANGRAPIFLDVMADTPEQLAITPEQLAAHRALATQATKLFGARHFAHYDFLLAISDQLGGIGLEHHQSSENGVKPGYFVDWNKSSVERDLLPHEFTHSWNGKFRRGADLATPNTNVPMQNSLLWMYEGQTQYWGDVLAARSGLVPMADMRDRLAGVAAWFEGQSGRAWRSLQDTTNTAIFNDGNGKDRDWRDWQRDADYYDEMVMVWLEADMLIRDASAGARSLDDFARAFFGPVAGRRDSDISPRTYRFDDVVTALNRVQPYDWAKFLRDRLDSHQPTVSPTGLERAGWRLAWSEEPNSYTKGRAERSKYDDFAYSLGINIGKDDDLTQVRWGSPAFDAGLNTSVRLIAVDGHTYKAERLKRAITAAKTSKAPIQLLVKDGDVYKTVSINYTGGLRYPKLERIEGTEDRLTTVLSAKP
jgi:predicted metalloprotease with PDZ domain